MFLNTLLSHIHPFGISHIITTLTQIRILSKHAKEEVVNSRYYCCYTIMMTGTMIHIWKSESSAFCFPPTSHEWYWWHNMVLLLHFLPKPLHIMRYLLSLISIAARILRLWECTMIVPENTAISFQDPMVYVTLLLSITCLLVLLLDLWEQQNLPIKHKTCQRKVIVTSRCAYYCVIIMIAPSHIWKSGSSPLHLLVHQNMWLVHNMQMIQKTKSTQNTTKRSWWNISKYCKSIELNKQTS